MSVITRILHSTAHQMRSVVNWGRYKISVKRTEVCAQSLRKAKLTSQDGTKPKAGDRRTMASRLLELHSVTKHRAASKRRYDMDKLISISLVVLARGGSGTSSSREYTGYWRLFYRDAVVTVQDIKHARLNLITA